MTKSIFSFLPIALILLSLSSFSLIFSSAALATNKANAASASGTCNAYGCQ